jgi:hypothetical protein
MGILFYEGIGSLLISTILLLFFIFRKNQDKMEKIHRYYFVIISFFLILSFHTTVITIIDRSISVFMINKVGEGVSTGVDLEKHFIEEFSGWAVKKRVEEQIQLKNFQFEQESIVLTVKGKLYLTLFRLIKKIYNLDESIL